MLRLFLTNIPHDCTDQQLQEWIESRGIQTTAIRVIRDLVAGVSPSFGYVDLKDKSLVMRAVSLLDGQRIGSRTIQVEVAADAFERRTA